MITRIFLTLAALFAAGCSATDPASSDSTAERADDTAMPIQPFVDLPEVVKPVPMPTQLDPQTEQELLEAVAHTGQVQKVLRGKENNGQVVLEQAPLTPDEARFQLDMAKAELAGLSESVLPTYALLHRIDGEGRLETWLIGPDGGVVKGVSDEPYEGLGPMAEGLGIKRMAISRSPTKRGTPLPTKEEILAAQRADRTRKAIEARGVTLEEYAKVLLPGPIRDALGTRKGRLLVIPARDTGTAPYAALPLANGYAAENWSFVLLPDFATFSEENPGFDFERLDIGKAVIVGDPDLSHDTSWNWTKLPGARAEAKAVAQMLDVPQNEVMIGKDATREHLLQRLRSSDDTGLVYIATHAVSNKRFPLTKGYMAMAGHHYHAGDIRQAEFPGWRINHPLVVLSACQTALGRYLEGGGFGIARTWTTAGAGQVVGSLWNVSDKATKVLMTRFTHYLKQGYAPEFAMQKAQRDTLNYRDEKGRHPYRNDPKMWASFSVFGYPSITTRMPDS